MRFLIGILCLIGALAIWTFAISLLLSWLAICFGSVVIGLILLFVAPYVLLAPLAVGVPGTALFIYGMGRLANKDEA